jgi:hypothetical protein
VRAVSARFLAALTGSHKMVARARVCTPGQTGTNPAGTAVALVGGEVRMDITAAVRALASISVVGEFPRTPSGLFTPYGNELYLERGIDYGDGVREYVGLGYFRLDEVSQSEARRLGEISISASDRMSSIVDARILEPFEFGPTATVAQVFDLLIKEVFPAAVIEFDFDPNITFGVSHVVEESRFNFLDDIVRAWGKIWYWDHRGILVVKTAPNPANPVWTVSQGTRGVLVSMSRKITRAGVYNAVVATGESAGESPPVRGFAVDSNPLSPTRWDGPYGKVPKFYTSSFIKTTAQAETAARAMLQRELGLPYQVDFTAIPNPALELLDPVAVSYDARENVEVHVIEKLTIPLTVGGGAMPASTRQKLIGAPVA